jgi:ribosomal protein L24
MTMKRFHNGDRVKIIRTHGKNNNKEGVITEALGNTCYVLLDNGVDVIIPDPNYQLVDIDEYLKEKL